VFVCVSYCRQYNWTHGHAVLVRPYDTTFMFYESVTDAGSDGTSVSVVFEWLTRHLLQRIHTVTSLTELQHDWLPPHTQQVNVIVCFNDSLSSASKAPLFFAVLSVVFEGRVRFARVGRSIAAQAVRLPQQQMSVVISTAQLTYIYGSGDADCLTATALRGMLTILAPSAADLVDFAITLSLLFLCLEPCLVFSGLKSRLLRFVSLSLQLCLLFLLYCFFVSYVIPEHEMHLLLDDLLPIWRYIMLTSFGDLVRRNWLRYTTVNFGSFIMTYFMYLLLVAWLYQHLYRQKKALLTTYWTSAVDEDEVEEYIDWYTWQNFGVPDFWLESQARSLAPSCEVSVQSVSSCSQCRLPLSYGCKVCKLACQHAFHRSCLAQLLSCRECVCPTCRSHVYAVTAVDDDASSCRP